MGAFTKVQQGQPVKGAIRADTWNAMIDAAIAERGRQLSGGLPPLIDSIHRGIVLVKNDEAGPVQPYQALAIAGVLVQPGNDAEQVFQNRMPLRGRGMNPDTMTPLSFVVAQEQIAAGALGRCVISGVTIARLNVVDAADTTCEMAEGSLILRSCPFGGAPVLWKESGTGEKWAVVELGHALPEIVVGRILAINSAGGVTAAGDVEGMASDITYRVGMLYGSRTWDNVTPANTRPSMTLSIKSAKVGTRCFGFWDGEQVEWHITEGLADMDPCDADEGGGSAS